MSECSLTATHVGDDNKTYCGEHGSSMKRRGVAVSFMTDLAPAGKPVKLCRFDPHEEMESPTAPADELEAPSDTNG